MIKFGPSPSLKSEENLMSYDPNFLLFIVPMNFPEFDLYLKALYINPLKHGTLSKSESPSI